MNSEYSSLESYIEDYEEWIRKEIPINDGWVDEINYLSFLREEIHQKLKSESSESLTSRLKLLDSQWQTQIASTIDKKFRYTDKPQQYYPEDFWWWHIDRLDELTEGQKSTL